MRPFRSNIRFQLRISLIMMLLAPVLVGVFALTRLSALNGNIEQSADDHVLTTAYVWKGYLQDAALRMNNFLTSDDLGEARRQLTAIIDERKKRQEAMEKLSASINSPEVKPRLQDALAAQAAYASSEQGFLELAEAGDKAAARKLFLERARSAQLATIDALDRLIDVQTTGAATARRALTHQYYMGRTNVILCTLLLFVAGSALVVYAARRFYNQLGGELDHADEIARRIAAGDFNAEIRIRAGDQSSLLSALKLLRDNLLKIVSLVSEAADSVRQGTTRLSDGNAELTRRTQEQSSALAVTSASMEELTTSVKQNADNARQTTRRAMVVCEQAESGGAVVQRAVCAMAEISASSRKIADIISVIDGIAFQTNLLALNAAVEAARAGEQGRGFAVVASEVRNLALRSATAAKEIKGLITESVAKVGVGSKLIDESGRTLTQIIVSVKEVASVIADIASASEAQAAGIDEVNTAVAQMDATTHQNSALVDNAATTSENIRRQAEDLVAKVAFFRTVEADVTGSKAGIDRTDQQGIPDSKRAAWAANRAAGGNSMNGARPPQNVYGLR